ncbi:MAG: DUF1553 domain-containing protein [Planctomycetota bacterium]
MMLAFDFPETDISCEARFLTTQPAQALTMLNSDWMQMQARNLFARIKLEVGDDLAAQTRRALELCISREPLDEDVDELMALTNRLVNEHNLEQSKAREAMCLVALNLNQFLYLD